MKIKKLPILLIASLTLLIVVSTIVNAQSCEVDNVKQSLRKVLYLHFVQPQDNPLTLSEVVDLLAFYLSYRDEGTPTVDCSVTGAKSDRKIEELVNEASGSPNVIPTCIDGTAYGECSNTKPKYCYAGSLMEKCGTCGCTTGTCSSTGECATLTTSGNITCAPSWQCTTWSQCTNSTQIRTCTDYDSCGTTAGKPIQLQTCTTNQTQTTCSWTANGICPAGCAAGSDADCCTQAGKYVLTAHFPPNSCETGCYNNNYTNGTTACTPCDDINGYVADGACPNWCSAGNDLDCCTNLGKCWFDGYGCYDCANPPGTCSWTANGICPAGCAAGSDADCCTQAGKYVLMANLGDSPSSCAPGCYSRNYTSGTTPCLSCSGAASDGACPNWCSAGSDADCS